MPTTPRGETILFVRAPWIAAWLAFVYLAWAASPAHFWLDSGEIGAAGVELGVAHPPGAPGLLFLLHVAGMIPLGSLGFRMAVLSSLLAAGTVGLLITILMRRGAGPWLAGIGGAWVVVGLTFVRQARVVEVYALAGALLMVTLWGLDSSVPASRRTGRRLLAVGAATWAAWCFGDLRLALGPIVLVAWIVAWRRRAPWSRWAPLVAAMATLVILALPLASVGAPVTDWGDPDTLSAWIDQLSARSIRDSFSDEILPASASLWALHARGALSRLAEDLGAPGLVMAAICLGLMWRRDPAVEDEQEASLRARGESLAIAWLVLVQLVYAIGINPMGGADRQTGLVLAPLAALVVCDVARRWLRDRERLRWATLPLLGVVLILPPLLVSVSDPIVTRSWAPHAWSRAALAQLPPGTLLLTQSDDLAAGTLSARMLEGARPDVISIPAQHLYRPTPDAVLGDPEVAKIWEAAHQHDTEGERIIAAIAAHKGPAALELPHTGLFAGIGIKDDVRGQLPLAIIASKAVDAALPAVRTPPQEVEAWLGELPAGEDRRRLAVALASFARAELVVRGDAQRAAATLAMSLGRVYERQPGALVTLGALHDRMGDRPRAIALTRRALELEPGRHVALTNLARYLVMQPGGADEAVALAEDAVALRPWRADGWKRLAEVRAALGDAEGAAEAQRRSEEAAGR